MELHARFAQIVANSSQTVKEFAAEVGIRPNAVTEIIHGRTKTISWPILLLLHDFKQVNLNWLISGKGEPYILDAKTRKESESKLLLLMKQDPELIEQLLALRPGDDSKIELAKKVLELDDQVAKSLLNFLKTLNV